MTKDDNIKVFQDTLNKIQKSNILTEAVNKSNAAQQFISDVNNLPEKTLKLNPERAKIIVTKSSSFDAARKYNNVAVLNFASATNPGGGVVHGSFAQEECLCRCSTLYCSLIEKSMMDQFYTPHRNGLNALHNDDIIYTPGVVIFKSDAYTNLYQNKTVNVITCAAPNLREKPANAYNNESSNTKIEISDEDLLKLHEQRGRAILKTAHYFGNDNVVLGAFGCGAFKNNPEIVAQAYKNILPEFNHAFKTIEFAVFCKGEETTNYNVFKKALG